ncbi:hypothetical protein BJV78DRAFT_207246 [Lactifluus subvellereus]|nr:hypothetical protein BJV78DRAFT_207246 [Lactifluus subvellereus]
MTGCQMLPAMLSWKLLFLPISSLGFFFKMCSNPWISRTFARQITIPHVKADKWASQMDESAVIAGELCVETLMFRERAYKAIPGHSAGPMQSSLRLSKQSSLDAFPQIVWTAQ